MDTEKFSCEKCGGNHPTEAHPTDIRLASREELEGMHFEDMKALFDENEKVLLEHLASHNIPYFGLHGAARPALEMHKKLASEGSIRYDVATFADKNVDKQTLLNSLYVCADLTSNYAFTELGIRDNSQASKDISHEGGIEVINLEGEQGTIARVEKGGYKPKYPADENSEVVSGRGIIILSPETYSRIVGIITNEDLKGYPEIYNKYFSDANEEHSKNGFSERHKFLHGKYTYIKGLLNQAVIEKSFEALGLTKTK